MNNMKENLGNFCEKTSKIDSVELFNIGFQVSPAAISIYIHAVNVAGSLSQN
jgi:hypothetical protein